MCKANSLLVQANGTISCDRQLNSFIHSFMFDEIKVTLSREYRFRGTVQGVTGTIDSYCL